MARPLTLDRKVKKLIQEHGPIVAGFMAQAMANYCEGIRATPTEELQKQIGNMFDAATWQHLATAVQTELAK